MMIFKIMKKISNDFDELDLNEKNIFLIMEPTTNSVRFFFDNIYNNIFLKEDTIKYCSDIYIKAKNIINKLNRFVYLYKLKKAIKYDVCTDLYFNDLKFFNNNQKIIIFQNNTLYTFRVANLISMWVDKLQNNNDLFPEPLSLKNPYTNIKFNKSHLYNIYFSMLFNSINIPLTINLFYRKHFDLIGFTTKYYPFLKDIAIDNFLQNSSNYEIYEQLLNMFYEFKGKINFLVLNDSVTYSNKLELINIFKINLKYYLIGKYCCNPIKKQFYYKKSKELLVEYIRAHPEFKRKYNLSYDYTINMNNRTEISHYSVTSQLNLERTRNNRLRNIRRNIQYPPPPSATSPPPSATPPPPPPSTTPPSILPPPPPSTTPPPPYSDTSSNDDMTYSNLSNRLEDTRIEINNLRSRIINSETNLFNPFAPINELPRSPIQRIQ
jgi:hypothetical protein